MLNDPNTLLEAAIRDLGAWKMHVETAIDTGYCAVPSIQAHDHEACELGQWLAQSTRPDTERLIRLHNAFHSLAGDILRYVELGEPEEAQVLFETDLLELSAALVLDLRRWVFAHHAKSA